MEGGREGGSEKERRRKGEKEGWSEKEGISKWVGGRINENSRSIN